MKVGSPMEELKNRIWDHLYRLAEPQQVAAIADEINESSDAVRQAVDDPWFDIQDGLVAIAYDNR